MSDIVTTVPDGQSLPLDSLAQTFTGNPITSITVEYPPGEGKTYTQTITYASGVVTSTSAWTLNT